MNFDDFDLADTALLGGVLGFLEEAAELENKELDGDAVNEDAHIDIESDFKESVADWVSKTTDVQLRLLYNENPDLVEFMIKKFYQEREQDLKAVETMEIQEVRKEMQEELEKLEQDELNTN